MLFKNHPRGLVQAALANMGERQTWASVSAIIL